MDLNGRNLKFVGCEHVIVLIVIMLLLYIGYSPARRSVLGKTVPEVLDTGTQERWHSFSQYGPT